MTQALNLANFANNLNTAGATSNTGLQNSSVTVTAGTGMSGGGAVALGSSITLTNAGVTSVTAGTGISVSASTGGVTITNTAGSVLQVVQTTLTGATTLANPTSFTATSLTASITPKFSTSKILITMSYSMYNGSTGNACNATIYKNGTTNISPNSSQGFMVSYIASGNVKCPFTISYLDSPATTSSTSYTCYVKTSAGNMDFGDGQGCGTVILTEIAG